MFTDCRSSTFRGLLTRPNHWAASIVDYDYEHRFTEHEHDIETEDTPEP